MSNNTDTETSWIIDLRVIATIAVIILHVSAIAFILEYKPLNVSSSNLTTWHIANIFNSLVRFCVPVFVMLTGVLLLSRKIELFPFLKRRINRIILPFIFWSAIYSIFNLILKIKHHEHITFLKCFQSYFIDLAQGASFHLWYIYMIICLYIFIPIIGPWIKNATNWELSFFLTVWVFTLLTNQLNANLFTADFDFRYFSGYIGYLVLGYSIGHRLLITRNIIIFAALMFMIGFLITLLGTYFSTLILGSGSSKWHGYLSINVALMSAGIFVLVKAGQQKAANSYYIRIRNLINKYSYGIYLVHVLILGVLKFINIDYHFITPVFGILFTTILCLCLSLFIISFINKLPLGKYISG